MTAQVRSPLKYIGGKSASAERIVASFPSLASYDVYCEPCGGAAHVLLAKPPFNHHEVYCDLDDNLTTFWLEMQTHAGYIQSRLQALPYSRRIYYDYYRSLFNGTQLESLERAIRWFYCIRGTGTGWMRKSPPGWNGTENAAQGYRNALELFHALQERFARVAVDNRDVLATIKRYDSPKTLFYIDPPYFGAEGYYEPSKKGFPHEEMASLLQKVKGYVTVSYYPHPSIDMWYAPEKWRRMTWQQAKNSQIQIERREEDTATEMVLMNYPEAHGLWESA